jgi:hypothetical protein
MITQQDTYDTIMYGHIPKDTVISVIKEKHGNDILDNFDFFSDEVKFIQSIPFHYDEDKTSNYITDDCTDYITIACYILEPDEDSNKVNIVFDMDTTTSKYELPDYMNTFKDINKRSDIDNLLMDWREFVGLCFVEILAFYKENKNIVPYDIPLMLSDISENLCHFKEVDLS